MTKPPAASSEATGAMDPQRRDFLHFSRGAINTDYMPSSYRTGIA